MRRIDSNVMLSALFALLIISPMTASLSGLKFMTSFTENRTLAPFPHGLLRKMEFARFGQGFDEYVSDHFGFRPYLISAFASVKFAVGTSVNPIVAFGRDGYLISASGSWDRDDYRGIATVDPKLLENWRLSLEQRRIWLAGMGIHFLVTIPPVKETVYPEVLPSWLQRRGDQTRVGQFLRYLQGSAVD